ncbi:MAG: hypothetical protein AB3N11_03450, partial [Arenibacterium sp.]
MAKQNTSLLFAATGEPLYRDLTPQRVDTGESLIFSTRFEDSLWDFDEILLSSSLTLYLDARFGLQPWVELGSTGAWDAAFNIDVNVDLPNAVIIPAYAPGTALADRPGARMAFDFSDYNVVDGKVETVGFSTDEKAETKDPRAKSGIDLIVDFSAGIREFSIDGPLPGVGDIVNGIVNVGRAAIDGIASFGSSIGSALGFGLIDTLTGDPDEYSVSNVSFFDENEKVTLVERKAGQEEFRPSIPTVGDYFEFYLKAPIGANTSGESEGSGSVTATGKSSERFIGLEADIDALLLKLLDSFQATKPVAEALGKTVFWEGNVLNWASFDEGLSIPDSLANFALTVVDLTGGLGLKVDEEFTVDINDKATWTPNVNIHLKADNGSEARGKLGDTLYLESPKTGFGSTNVTATFTLGDVQAEHTAQIKLEGYFNVKILEGEISVGGKKLAGFDALYDEDVLEAEIADLGKEWSESYTVNGAQFGQQQEVYSVFYVEDRLAPKGWDPEDASFENDLYAYFESAYEQVEAIYERYEGVTFDFERPTDATAVPASLIIDLTGTETINGVVYDYRGKSVGYAWSGLFDADVRLTHDNAESRVLVGAQAVPAQSGGTQDIFVQTVRGFTASGAATFAPVSANGPIEAKYNALIASEQTAKVRFDSSNGKYLETRNVVDFVGGALGDILYYNNDASRDLYGGTFFDGGGNRGASHDLFIADFGDVTTDVYWDIAAAVDAENDASTSTMGGVTIKDAFGRDVVVRNVEAAFLITGLGDDYLVGGRHSDGFLTGGGNDIVRLSAYIENANSDPDRFGRTDVSNDYVRLGAGKDTALVQFADVSTPRATAFTDYIFGGTGADFLYVGNGNQGLHYNYKVVTSAGDNI